MAGRISVHFIKTWVDHWNNKYARFAINDNDRSDYFDIEIRKGKRGHECALADAKAKAIQEFENAQT